MSSQFIIWARVRCANLAACQAIRLVPSLTPRLNQLRRTIHAVILSMRTLCLTRSMSTKRPHAFTATLPVRQSMHSKNGVFLLRVLRGTFGRLRSRAATRVIECASAGKPPTNCEMLLAIFCNFLGQAATEGSAEPKRRHVRWRQSPITVARRIRQSLSTILG